MQKHPLIHGTRAKNATRSRLLAMSMVAFLLVSLVFSQAPDQVAQAAGPFTVNTTSDTHCTGFVAQGAPGCSSATDSGGHISLRSALEAANTAGGATTITLPAGTYNLTLGDLVAGTQANTTITIQGAGAASTTINQTTTGRMVIVQNYNVNANVVLNLSGVTISGGSENENDPDGFGGNGGAILAGGSPSASGVAVIITNTVFSGNYCSPVTNAGCSGGAINMVSGGSLTVTNSTFNGNVASKNRGFGAGGAIYFDNGGNGGNVTITNSVFTNNVAQGNSTTGGQGGAVRLAGSAGTTYTLASNTFTGNAANGTAAAGAHGGALYLSLGSLTANFNRIVGNTNADSSGLYVANNAGSAGAATNNWWGCNGGPGAAPCDIAILGTPNQGGAITTSPWIVLTNTASPNPIQVNQTTTLTADFLHNSTGGSLSASQISALVGAPVTWGSAVKGALSSTQASIQSSGTAAATFTASAAGAGSASATVDSGTAAVSITINRADTTTAITSETPDPTVTGQSYTVNFSVTSNTGSSPTAPTGTVTVSDGTDSCSGTIASGSCAIISTTVGSKTLTAAFSGDGNFNPSTSTSVSHTVNSATKADTTTTITSQAPNPSVVGQSVTLNYSVTVNSPGSGTPTGNVTVTDGTESCTGTVAAGACAITFPAAGSYSLTASYAGDANDNASPASSTVTQTVNKADTTTTITADSPDPSTVGQVVTVNYTVAPVAPGAGTPTGNVTVSDGVNSCTGTVASGTCAITLTTPGSRTLTATYAGDSNFNTSVSGGEPHAVNPFLTNTNITLDTPDPSVVGQTVTVQYSVTAASGVPTGNVTVSDGTVSCTGTVAAGQCSLTFTSAGAKSLTATYAGDSNYAGSASAGEAHQVNKADTTTTITAASPDPSSATQAVTVKYTVAVNSPGAGTPAGSVTVSDGTVSCTATVSTGQCALTMAGGGAHTLSATYAGDNDFNGSTSAALTHTVDATPPDTTILTNPANPSNSTSAAFTFTGSDNLTAAASLTFQCALDGAAFTACTSPQSYSGLTLGSHTFQARAIDSVGNVDPTPASFTWKIQTTTSLLYNGGQTVTIGSTFTPAALLSSPVAACASGQTIAFSLERNPTNGASGSYALGVATTNSSGQATLSAVSTTGWQEGVYTITAVFGGTPSCGPSSSSVTLAVGSAGNAAIGGGWYTLSSAGRVNFGFTVSKTVSTCTSNCTYKGQLLMINGGKWRLKGALTSYVKTGTGAGAASGTGTLYWWNQALNGGLGDWVLAQSGVSFTASFYDSGKPEKYSTDTFGINIQYTPVAPQPSTLPNSTPQLLKGGNIFVK